MRETPSNREQEQVSRFVRWGLVLGIGYLFLTVLSPFFTALAWAGILSYALYPLYRRLVKTIKGPRSLSAFLMCLVVILGIVLPIVYLSIFIAEDLTRTYRSIALQVSKGEGLFQEGWQHYPVIALLEERLQELERVSGTNIRAALANNLTELGRVLVLQLTSIAKNFMLAMIQLGIMLICCFYFFRDGETLVAWIQDTLPIPITRDHLLIQRFREVLTGSIYGNTFVAVIEGVIGGVAFWIVGLPSPVLWGAVMGILAYLPLVGASVVWIPGAVYFFFQAAYAKVIVLCVVGVVIGIVEYFVRPICVGKASKIHSLLVFFSVLGGIKLFGLLGIVAGPLIVAVGVTIMETYRLDKKPAHLPG